MPGPCALVDPDQHRRAKIEASLTRAGVSGIIATDSPAAISERLDQGLPLELAVIAMTQPTDAPLVLMSRLRVMAPACLILALDAVDSPDSAAWPFSAGAHDVLRLPFRPAELQARLTRGLRQLAPESERAALSADALCAKADLTQAEERILRVLVAHQGRIVSRNELSQHLHGTDWTYRDRRFDVHIGRIRRKLSEVLDGLYAVRTVRSAGYVLDIREPD
jgi:DNA-binding response OmpR family regulator